jgi:hypothetical protein
MRNEFTAIVEQEYFESLRQAIALILDHRREEARGAVGKAE